MREIPMEGVLEPAAHGMGAPQAKEVTHTVGSLHLTMNQ